MATYENDHLEGNETRCLVRPLKWRLNLAVWLNSVLEPVSICLGVYVGALLLLKLTWPAGVEWSLVALAFLPVALIYGFYKARLADRFFASQHVIEIVDHIYRNDGAVTAVFEAPRLAPSEHFFASVSEDIADRFPRLSPTYYLRRLVPFFVIIPLALVIPSRSPAEGQQSREIIASLTQPLIEQIEENVDILPEEEVQELMESIEEIRESEKNVSKEQWESIEEMERRVSQAVERSQNSASAVAMTVNQAMNMMGSSDATSTAGNIDARMAQLLNDLATSMNNPAMPLSSAVKRQVGDMMQMCEGGNCSGLGKALDDLRRKLGQGDGDDQDDDGDGFGRGGIDRGRGDAPMVFGAERELTDAFYDQEEILNEYLTGDDLVDLGITPLEPEPDPGKFSPGTLRNYGAVDGTQVSRTLISPAQKDVVAGYFAE